MSIEVIAALILIAASIFFAVRHKDTSAILFVAWAFAALYLLPAILK